MHLDELQGFALECPLNKAGGEEVGRGESRLLGGRTNAGAKLVGLPGRFPLGFKEPAVLFEDARRLIGGDLGE